MTKEGQIKSWETEDFDEWSGQLIPKSLKSLIAGERERNRKEIHESAKRVALEILPELAEKIDVQYTKATDIFKLVLQETKDAMKSNPSISINKPKETPEQVESRLRNEFAVSNAKREVEGKINGAYSRVLQAVGGKVDENYLDSFEEKARKTYQAEIGENGEVYFKKGDVPVYDGDKPASAAKIASELMKQYPRFLTTGIPGPDLRTATTTTIQAKGEHQYDPLGAAFKERLVGIN